MLEYRAEGLLPQRQPPEQSELDRCVNTGEILQSNRARL